MKKLILIFTIIILSAGSSFAHLNGKMAKELHDFKLKYLAQEMELTKDQQPRFFELYDKMQTEKKAAFAEVRKLHKRVKEAKNVSENDYKMLADAKDRAREKNLEIEKKYEVHFAKFLSASQIYKWHEAEKKFREKMKEMHKSKKKK